MSTNNTNNKKGASKPSTTSNNNKDQKTSSSTNNKTNNKKDSVASSSTPKRRTPFQTAAGVDARIYFADARFLHQRKTFIDHAFGGGVRKVISHSRTLKECHKNAEYAKTYTTAPTTPGAKDGFTFLVSVGIDPKNVWRLKERSDQDKQQQQDDEREDDEESQDEEENNDGSSRPTRLDKFCTTLHKLIDDNPSSVVAVNSGLDFSIRDLSQEDKERQLDVLYELMVIADTHDLPIFVSIKDAMDGTFQASKEFCTLFRGCRNDRDMKLDKVILCGYDGNATHLKKYISWGIYFTVNGAQTSMLVNGRTPHPSVVEAIKYIPLNRLLLESASPFCATKEYSDEWLVPFAQQESEIYRNQSDSLGFISSAYSKMIQEDADVIEAAVRRNFNNLFC